MGKVQRTCKNCRKGFTARQADVRRGWAKFCSKSCKAVEQESRTGAYRRYMDKDTKRYPELGPDEFYAVNQDSLAHGCNTGPGDLDYANHCAGEGKY